MDWGLAQLTETFGKRTLVLEPDNVGGTPAYMSPEMAKGQLAEIRTKSDIYLLGGILFKILTGRAPHHGKNVYRCLLAAANNTFVQTNITGELIEIAYHAMATDPDERFEDVPALQRALRDYLEHSESIRLSTIAEEDFSRARETDNYQDFAKALIGCEEALRLWAGNTRGESQAGEGNPRRQCAAKGRL